VTVPGAPPWQAGGMSGFEFHEALVGSYERPGAAPRPVALHLHARVEHLIQHLRDHKARVDGSIEAEGLAARAPLLGEMVIDPLRGGVIEYRFTFTGDDGRPYRFAGRKDVVKSAPVASLTTLRGEVHDEGDAIWATAELHFALRTLPEFLASFRPVV
jgi:hypothetical protein